MKTSTFRKINFTISCTGSYGRYELEAMYRGHSITTYITDSEVYDFVDSDNASERNDARRYCYNRIVEAYEELA